MMKNSKKRDLREQKSALKIKFKIDGLNQFLGHVFPILYDANHPPGHRDIWAS
jgi:hypothetical protein